jgi:hypothetical protein
MNAKIVLCAMTLLIAVLICGCTSAESQPATAAAANETPDLIGNWTGTMVGYEYGEGYADYTGYTMTLSITEQHDRIFSGEITYTNESGSPVWGTTPFAGAIGRDGTTLTLIEPEEGYSTGSLIGSDEMELIYANGDDPIEIAIDSLKRS